MEQKIKIITENKIGERPSWDEYFMQLAITTSSRASCFKVQAGSIITRNNYIVGTGYNGAPPKVKSCLEKGYCHKEHITNKNYEDAMNQGLCIGVHGEINALNHLQFSVDRSDLTLYTTIFPCNSCAKSLAGIKRLVYKSDYDGREFENAFQILTESGTEICKLNLSPKRYIDIAFNHPKVVHDVWSCEEKTEIKKILEKKSEK